MNLGMLLSSLSTKMFFFKVLINQLSNLKLTITLCLIAYDLLAEMKSLDFNLTLILTLIWAAAVAQV